MSNELIVEMPEVEPQPRDHKVDDITIIPSSRNPSWSYMRQQLTLNDTCLYSARLNIFELHSNFAAVGLLVIV